jgi:hypothetical protein
LRTLGCCSMPYKTRKVNCQKRGSARRLDTFCSGLSLDTRVAREHRESAVPQYATSRGFAGLLCVTRPRSEIRSVLRQPAAERIRIKASPLEDPPNKCLQNPHSTQVPLQGSGAH